MSTEVTTNVTLEGAGVICLALGISLIEKGNYSWGIAVAVLGAGFMALKYKLRGDY
ncbi:MAG: hypothetical protein AB1467_06870 [Candidatus Diapherotrites archaeon]